MDEHDKAALREFKKTKDTMAQILKKGKDEGLFSRITTVVSPTASVIDR